MQGRPGLLRTVLEQQETRGLTRSDDLSRLLPSEVRRPPPHTPQEAFAWARAPRRTNARQELVQAAQPGSSTLTVIDIGSGDAYSARCWK